MTDADCVDGIERTSDLAKINCDAPQRQAAGLQLLAQSNALNEFHRQIHGAAGQNAAAVNADYIRMMDLFERQHLLLEAPVDPLLVSKLAAKYLDSAAPPLLRAVAALGDNRKSAASQDPAHFEPAIEYRIVQLLQFGRKGAKP